MSLGMRAMPIYRLLQNSPLGPERIALLVAAYEQTLKELDLVERSDPVTQLVAKKILEIGERGVNDADQISEIALKELGL
jgi:hypothetical protein